MWDLPGPGIKPVSPALAGGFLTTAPPGKSMEQWTLDCGSGYMIVCICQNTKLYTKKGFTVYYINNKYLKY